MIVRILNISRGIDLHPLAAQSSALHLRERRIHLRAEPRIGAHHPMPRQCRRLLLGEAAHHESDVPRHHVHVNGNAPVGREFARRDQADEPDDLRANAGERFGFRFRHGFLLGVRLLEVDARMKTQGDREKVYAPPRLLTDPDQATPPKAGAE